MQRELQGQKHQGAQATQLSEEGSFSLRQAALSSLSLSFPKGSNSCHILLPPGLKWRLAELDLPKATEWQSSRSDLLSCLSPFCIPMSRVQRVHTPLSTQVSVLPSVYLNRRLWTHRSPCSAELLGTRGSRHSPGAPAASAQHCPELPQLPNLFPLKVCP